MPRQEKITCPATFPTRSANWRKDFTSYGGVFDPVRTQAEITELERKLAEEGAWNNHVEANKINARFERLREELAIFKSMEKKLDDLKGFVHLIAESPDASLEAECQREIGEAAREIDRLEVTYFLDGPYDRLGAFLSIHSGAGGTEAQDWAQMLLRMYLRWAEDHGFTTEIVDSTPGEEAGLKSVTVQIDGSHAYGLLVPEKGVHRLVRISPFDSNKRRHTSFASVDVIPRIEEEIKVDIKDDDIRVDTFRASGAGGQLVNKTSSAVRITHLPTGIVVQCQNERSQHQNRASAMAVLRSKLFDLGIQKQEERLDKIRGERKAVEFGSQIRSYVFMPYTQVKDLRTGLEINDVPKVMDGGIDPFITNFLRQRARKKRDKA